MSHALLRRNFVCSGAATLAALPTGAANALQAASGVTIRQSHVGLPPDDFDFSETGAGTRGRWTVIKDPTAAGGLAIEQSSMDETESRFPIAIYTPLLSRNMEVRSRF